MIITKELKDQHDKLLEKIKKELFYEGFGTQRPTSFAKHSKALGDIYAFFMRYDRSNEPISKDGKEIPIKLSSASEEEYLEEEGTFEKDLVLSLKQYKQKNPSLFDICGIELLEQKFTLGQMNGTSLCSFAWRAPQAIPRILNIRYKSNAYIIYNENINKDNPNLVISSQYQKTAEKFNENTLFYVFNKHGDGDYRYLGLYFYKKDTVVIKKDSVEFKVCKIWNSASANAEIIPDYKESEKEKFSSERYKRDPQKRDESIYRAKGRCQNPSCKCPESFLSFNEEPFLESHHIEFLSEKGQDLLDNMIALCPNCHSMSHYAPEAVRLQLKKDFKKVIKTLSS